MVKKFKIRWNESLSFNLIKVVFSFYFVLTFFITIGQMYAEFQSTENDLRIELKTILKGYEKGLARGLFNMEFENIKTLAKGMLSMPSVTGIKIITGNKEQNVHLGQTVSDLEGVVTYDGKNNKTEHAGQKIFWISSKMLYIDEDGAKETVGNIHIYSNYKTVLTRVKFGFILIIFTAILKTILLWGLFIWVIKSKLSIPLRKFGEKANNINFESLETINIAEDYFGDQNNELRKFEESFNFMVKNLISSKNELVESRLRAYKSRDEAEREKEKSEKYLLLLGNANKKLDKYSKNLEIKVKDRTKHIRAILKGLEEGLFTFDKELKLDSEFSDSTKDIFDINPESKTIEEVLRLNSDEAKGFKKWSRNVWDGRLSFKDLLPLAPKTCLKIPGKYIELDFIPIYEMKEMKRKVKRVICRAYDRTNERTLMEKGQEQKDRSEMIMSLLKTPIEFNDLINEMDELLETCSEIFDDLENVKGEKSISPDALFRSFHTLKARFGQFKITKIVKHIHEIESLIDEWKKYQSENFQITPDELFINLGNKIRSLVGDFYLFKKENNKIMEMAKSMGEMGPSGKPVDILEVKEFIEVQSGSKSSIFQFFKQKFVLGSISEKFKNFKNLIFEISQSQGKQTKFMVKEYFEPLDLMSYSEFLNSMGHIFRNSVDHGIEIPKERLEAGKEIEAQICVSFENIPERDDYFRIFIEDDGRGINHEVIKEFALTKNICSEEELEKMDEDEIINLIFTQGMSSRENVTELSGRGVGMDAVKFVVEKMGGTINIKTKVNKGTTFIIELPKLT